MDKNIKLWTNISSLLMNIQVNLESVFHVFVHNFMFLSTFSRKLYEHLNMFIWIGHVSWHLLNMFLSIFVTILSFSISTNQNHFKIKKTKLYYFQCRHGNRLLLGISLNICSFTTIWETFLDILFLYLSQQVMWRFQWQ